MGDPNLSRDEVAARAQLLAVDSYRIELDLADVATAATFRSRATVRFQCRRPGASTWIDLIAEDVTAATLNGRPLDPASYDGARLVLPDLAADNELVVDATCWYMRTGEGLHRSVDPTDGQVYLYTQFAVADARRVFSCFEQPDLKATFAWQVDAPAGWELVSTMPTPPSQPVGPGVARWAFPPTPRLSTYLAVLAAGPLHVERSTYEADGRSIPLALYCRASVADHLDAAEILDITRRGLAHYEAQFGMAMPFPTYGQVFLPEFNLGAMENPGAVIFREEGFLFRSRVTQAAREARANVILHEMAHMWFGDLVTMRWWDDLWLNESFAEWAGSDTSARATSFTQAWTTFAQSRKAWAYAQDQLPSTHPVSADMVDLEAVYRNFDGITYAKGASVLKQLVAWVGRDAFLTGLSRYFATHAWGSAQRADLLVELEAASGRDLSHWSHVWWQESGVTTLQPVVELDAQGRYRTVAIHQLTPTRPEGVAAVLRPHHVAVAAYRWDGEPGSSRLVRQERVEVDVQSAVTPVDPMVGRPAADVLVVNDDDLTYAKIRFDPASQSVALRSVGRFADSLPRALVWGSLWEQVRDALLPAQDFVAAALRGLADETRPGIIDTVLRQAHVARVRLAGGAVRAELAVRMCRGTRELLDAAEPGSDRQLALAQGHVACAVTRESLQQLAQILDGRVSIPGLELDQDLRWALVWRLCARGVAEGTLVERELERDRTTRGHQAAARGRAACADPQAKRSAWAGLVESGGRANAVVGATLAGFLDLERPDLMEPFRQPYVEIVRELWERRSPAEAAQLAAGLFPDALLDGETVRAVDGLLGRDDLPSGLRRILVEKHDGIVRALECRSRSERG